MSRTRGSASLRSVALTSHHARPEFFECFVELVNAINLAVGEYAFTLHPDDPLRGALLEVQCGLDALWRVASGWRGLA